MFIERKRIWLFVQFFYSVLPDLDIQKKKITGKISKFYLKSGRQHNNNDNNNKMYQQMAPLSTFVCREHAPTSEKVA